MSNQILSLFSGGGFLDLGFMNQGFQIVDAIEYDENFIKAYNVGIESYVNMSQKKILLRKKSRISLLYHRSMLLILICKSN